MKKILRDKKGVFGLNAVQSFFAIILGIALLAYVIVIIMGTLSNTTILPQETFTVKNESITFSATGVPQLLAADSIPGAADCVLTYVSNATNVGAATPITNFTLVGCSNIVNKTALFPYTAWPASNYSYTQLVSYTYTANSDEKNQLNGILGNTSTGISGFFNSINPVYAILAVLVIILVLVVLVRVVQAPNRQESRSSL